MIQHDDIPECSICLYAIAPSQALFVAPCAHIFHLKCLLPWIELSFPAFSCPLCRTYSDLEAKVEIDEDDGFPEKTPIATTFSRNNSNNSSSSSSSSSSSRSTSRSTSSSSNRATENVRQSPQQQQPLSNDQFTSSLEAATATTTTTAAAAATRPSNRRTRSASSKHFSGFPPLIKRVFSSSVNGLRSIMT